MKHRLYLILIAVLFLGGVNAASAQSFAIKTNLVYDATSTANLGIEVGLAPRWTLDISGNINTWSKNDVTKWKHWMVQPEARYWFCDRFSRHFLGMHLIGGAFNFGGINNSISILGTDFSLLKNQRYQGYAYGAGLAYGYAFMLGKYCNLEFEAGFGYMYLDCESFDCGECSRSTGSLTHHYIGPTKAAVNLVFLF